MMTIKMKTVYRKFLALTLAIAITVPGMALAQEIPSVAPIVNVMVDEGTDALPAEQVQEIAPVVEPETSTTEIALDDASSLVTDAALTQDTAPTQEAVSGDALEGTTNPEVATSTDTEIIPIVDASSTEPVIEDIPVVEEQTPTDVSEEIPLPSAEQLTVVETALTPVVEMIAEDFVPLKDGNESLDPEYVIAISGKVVPTHTKGIIGTSAFATPIATSIDSETGAVSVSGACASPYYVVLLFKNQTDYDVDPRSFIMNRAYPCENGSYFYSIDRLPTTISNGTYYLMVGEQGESGPWKPATSMTEITINRSN